MPRRAAAMVKEWANLHRAQLEDNWDICPDVLRLWCEQQPLMIIAAVATAAPAKNVGSGSRACVGPNSSLGMCITCE